MLNEKGRWKGEMSEKLQKQFLLCFLSRFLLYTFQKKLREFHFVVLAKQKNVYNISRSK